MRLLVLASLLFGVPFAHAQSFSRDLQGRIDRAVRGAMSLSATPGITIGLERPGGTFRRSYGIRDPKTLAPVRGNEHTRIGSVTKTFTTTAVLRLVDQGKVRLDDPISRYVPGVPDGDKITVRMLGNMSAGLASYTENDEWVAQLFQNPQRTVRPQELLDVAFRLKPTFAPGTGWHYSNTNTVVLGQLLERVTGLPAGEAIRSLVLEPLGLKNTSFPTDAALPEPFWHGFTVQPGPLTDATNWNPSWAYTAGAMISNLPDLMVWARALGTGRLLKPETFAERKRYAPVAYNKPDAYYGFGVGLREGYFGHTGELPGFNTACYYLPDLDTVIVVLANSDIAVGPNNPAPTIAKAVMAELRRG